MRKVEETLFDKAHYECEECGIQVYINRDGGYLNVYSKDDKHLGTIQLGDSEDLENAVAALENSCPICDKWENGGGVTCNIEGWEQGEE